MGGGGGVRHNKVGANVGTVGRIHRQLPLVVKVQSSYAPGSEESTIDNRSRRSGKVAVENNLEQPVGNAPVLNNGVRYGTVHPPARSARQPCSNVACGPRGVCRSVNLRSSGSRPAGSQQRRCVLSTRKKVVGGGGGVVGNGGEGVTTHNVKVYKRLET